MEREPQSAYSRLKATGLLQALQGRVAEANLYRFCQLLEQSMPDHPPLGSTTHPADDPVRFRPDPGMGFPAGELRAIETDDSQPQRPATVRTRLLGLYGVDSPLPTVFLDDITQRREGHEALEAFLDMFNHRIFTQFYRVWRKYSYPASFEAGGSDATSQCLLGLIGLGIAGTAERIATPVSRFLALLGVMRLPTRNAEGISALVTLLAPHTRVKVTAHWPRKIALAQPAGLSTHPPVRLSQGTPLGPAGYDANSQLRLGLFTEDRQEARSWLPGGRLYDDLLVLLQVYLGWRCTARLQLSLPLHSLPPAVLGAAPVLLGMTGVLGLDGNTCEETEHDTIAINLGCYQGLKSNPDEKELQHVAYHFPFTDGHRARRAADGLRADPNGDRRHGVHREFDFLQAGENPAPGFQLQNGSE
ncbi:type VI secretion system baseplate subunit TssG [Pseudomonas fluorescens]|uniref:type VI secretion system baseplate subunit TssG n=1 Tax=Pseudomonas fluorescens TaxID=294 RepID=UPI002ACAE880|nr:type VI secretion system baseplate subunit TssG [Pseudomonas fluorescens]MDZ5433229.1 type VI secretion system baseplate subunit TssG [Pseudomonas fluorescens]